MPLDDILIFWQNRHESDGRKGKLCGPTVDLAATQDQAWASFLHAQ